MCRCTVSLQRKPGVATASALYAHSKSNPRRWMQLFSNCTLRNRGLPWETQQAWLVLRPLLFFFPPTDSLFLRVCVSLFFFHKQNCIGFKKTIFFIFAKKKRKPSPSSPLLFEKKTLPPGCLVSGREKKIHKDCVTFLKHSTEPRMLVGILIAMMCFQIVFWMHIRHQHILGISF